MSLLALTLAREYVHVLERFAAATLAFERARHATEPMGRARDEGPHRAAYADAENDYHAAKSDLRRYLVGGVAPTSPLWGLV